MQKTKKQEDLMNGIKNHKIKKSTIICHYINYYNWQSMNLNVHEKKCFHNTQKLVSTNLNTFTLFCFRYIL